MSPLEKLRNYLAISRNLRLHDKVRDAFRDRGPVAHNWDHIFRDTVNAVAIGEPFRLQSTPKTLNVDPQQ